ncbi:MAG TPA: SpoIVB peptidase [Firmicutes bacterium]|nr:SpoIVB peptidase [Bacillota bacterium]
MPQASSRRRFIGVILAVFIVAAAISPPVRALLTFPDRVKLADDNRYDLGFRVPFITVRCRDQSIIQTSSCDPFSVEARSGGTSAFDVLLFGKVPVKRVRVDVLPRLRLIPGGHSIGVLLRSKGVIVTGLSPVVNPVGQAKYPAKEAGIRQGDVILTVNGENVKSESHMAMAVNEAGKSGRIVEITAKSIDGRIYTTFAKPEFCVETRRYRIGLWVRDGAAGVGTLTFLDPQAMRYAALGHIITDADTGRPLEVSDGEIVRATVTAVESGRSGRPGEKIGVFVQDEDALGSIDMNSRYGISGTLYRMLENPFYPEPLPIAMGHEVHVGPAEIITVVEEQRMEKFCAEIIKVAGSSDIDGKNLVIKITDPRLLKKTGGIIQGMSGSPIIQEGKLVGAVTHVFVNDPTKGYGVFIENMILESGIPLPGSAGFIF